MTERKTRQKSAQAIADTAPLLIQRQEGVYCEYGGVGFTLKGLTWQEQERVETMIQLMVQETRQKHPDSLPEPEDFDFQVGSAWRLRFGVHEMKVLPGCAPEVAAAVEMAEKAAKEVEVGGVKRKLYPGEFLGQLSVARMFYAKIDELSNLSQAEEIKLVFTSPS